MPNRKALLTNSIVKKEKAAKLKGVRYLGFDNVDTFSFSIKSATRRFVFHRIKLQVVELHEAMEDLVDVENITNINFIKSVLNYALTLKLRVYCSCEDFLYSGTKYWNYKNDSGIEEENRPPRPDKLKRRSLLCKHIRFILLNISRYLTVMAKSVSKAFEEEWIEYAEKNNIKNNEEEELSEDEIIEDIENITKNKNKSNKSSKSKTTKTTKSNTTKSKKSKLNKKF